MKHLIILPLLFVCSNLVSQTNTCDLELNSVEFNPNSTYTQPILDISNVGSEPVVNFQIKWTVDNVIRIWSFSNSIIGGVLEPGENVQLEMPEIYVPIGNINCSFEITNLNNGNPNLGSCLVDQDLTNNKVFIDINNEGPSCIDVETPFGICDEDQSLSVGELSNIVLDIESIEYYDIRGTQIDINRLHRNTIYFKRIKFSDGTFRVEKIIQE